MLGHQTTESLHSLALFGTSSSDMPYPQNVRSLQDLNGGSSTREPGGPDSVNFVCASGQGWAVEQEGDTVPQQREAGHSGGTQLAVGTSVSFFVHVLAMEVSGL